MTVKSLPLPPPFARVGFVGLARLAAEIAANAKPGQPPLRFMSYDKADSPELSDFH